MKRTLLLMFAFLCSMGVWADDIPTFGSLDELAATNLPNGTHVNVYIEGTAKSALIMRPEYTIYFTDKSRDFTLTTDIQYEPEWYQPGGMLTGTLKNVICERSGDFFQFKSPYKEHNIFEDLEFTPNYKSLNELSEAIGGIGIGSWVPVKLNENEIVEITDDAVLVKDGDNVFALKANSRPNWKVEGTLSGTWLAKYNGWDEELKAYTLQYAAKNSNPWADLSYTFVETYTSLEELIKSGQKSGPINITINNVIHHEWDDGKWWYVYVQSGNEQICLEALLPDSKPDWMPGGTLKATLTNVSWGYGDLRGENKDFWKNFTYTPPVVTEYESIEALLAADIQGAAVVTVKDVNSQISRIDEGDSYAVYLDDNKIFLYGDYNPDRDWDVGGTVTGKLENVIFMVDEGETPILYKDKGDILADLTYTAPSTVLTYTLSEFAKAEVEQNTKVSLSIDNEILYIEDSWVFLKDGDYIFLLMGGESCSSDWEVGGRLKGTWKGFYRDKMEEDVFMFSNGHSDPWAGLTYTAPAVGTISVSSVGYATYFTDKEFTMPEGLEGYVVTPKDETSVTLTKAFEGGEIVPASTALLVKGEAGSYPCAGSNTGATFTGDNCLHGNLTAGTVAEVSGASNYYKLLNGSNGLGWYLGAPDGGVFTLGANKAYLALTETQAQNAKALSLDFSDETTAINGIEDVNADSNVRYNLNGMKINSTYKGMYIKNGKKFINK